MLQKSNVLTFCIRYSSPNIFSPRYSSIAQGPAGGVAGVIAQIAKRTQYKVELPSLP